jgi:hypothetical protein
MERKIRLGNVKGISNLEESVDGGMILKLFLKRFLWGLIKAMHIKF